MPLLIWDLDGTLVDSRADIATAANAGLRAVGRAELPLATVVGFVGDGIGTLIERLTPGGNEAERARCRAAFEAAYATVCTATTVPYPGVPAALAALRSAGWTQAVATNKALAFTLPILAHCGLLPYLAAVRGGDGPRKPDPWALTDLMRELGARPDETWMVGDHHTDIKAARAAGCRVLFCAWGLGRHDGHAIDGEAAAPGDVPRRVGAFPTA